jgi:hypothetical protein
MTTRELLIIVERRGMRVVVEDGRPILLRQGSKDGVTDRLLAVLKRHREKIIALKTSRKS